jgi:predicted nucleic acid-binding protein
MLDIILPGSKIFIDSNILIYHFLDLSESCSILLERVEHGEVQAYISTVVQAEVLHRLMISEAVDKFGIKPNQAVRYLKEHPRAIASLGDFLSGLKARASYFTDRLLPYLDRLFPSVRG